MGKHAQIVMGPAGSGKSTFCQAISQHCANTKRSVHVVNLDPAAEQFGYKPSIDVRELISLEDVMEELEYGPNGGLVYCMEYLLDNIEWLEEQLGDYEEDYLIFDLPGQIELYTHLPIMTRLIEQLVRWDYSLCAVHLLDSLLISDTSRFIAGSLMSLSCMLRLELPHINVMTKCDLLPSKSALERYLHPDMFTLVSELNQQTSGKQQKLNQALGSVLEDFSLVGFLPLDLTQETSIEFVLAHIDHAMQYGEDLEPKEPMDGDEADRDTDVLKTFEELKES